MTWIPDIPSFFTSLQRIENEEDLLKDSVELFWLFCNGIMSPERFNERLEFWKGRYEKDKPRGGGFTDSELEVIMLEGFQNPDEAATIMLEKFESIVGAKSVEYIPDSTDPVIPLYVYLHLEAARLLRVLKVQGYSDVTRESIAKALNALNRCYMALESYPEPPWSWEYSISLKAVGSFLNTTHFFILKIDGRYEDALISLINGLEHIQESFSIFDNNRRSIFKSGLYFHHMNFTNDLRRTAPWINDVSQQLFVDCFEAIRKGNQIGDTNKLVDICESFIDYSDEPWLSNNRPDNTYVMPWLGNIENEISNNVETEQYQWDHATEYWREALGWVEAQTTPSEFKNIINEREEQAAEKRLCRYFFVENLWGNLPDRSKRSLISADRDWFSGSSVRIESILNEIRIAVEEILIQRFWTPLVLWIDENREKQRGTQEFIDFRTELSNKVKIPSILDFERLLKMPITGTYLVEKGVSREDRVWFIQDLQKSLYPLRRARNRAEHDPGNQLTLEEMNRFYSEFIGIGQPGVIRQLAQLLNSINDKD